MKIYRQSWTKLLFLYVLSRGAKTSPPCFSVQPFSVHSEMLQFLPVLTCRCTVMYGMLWLRHRKLPLYNYQTFMFVSHSQPTHTRIHLTAGVAQTSPHTQMHMFSEQSPCRSSYLNYQSKKWQRDGVRVEVQLEITKASSGKAPQTFDILRA